jgi:predicted AAA+ superfamily ATPase
MQNFWENKNWEKQDKHLIDLENRPFRRPFPHVQLQSGVTTLRGPRQIGKSSLMKTILLEACQKTSPGNIIFESCENIENSKELHEWLQLHRKKKYIFLDEFERVSIQFQDAFKAFIEKYNKNVRFIITTNHINKISDGIKSRIPQINFDYQNLNEEKFLKNEIYLKY